MFDLTDTSLNDVSNSEVYALLDYFNESITLKAGHTYTYSIEIPVDPTVDVPDPEPEVRVVYVSPKNSIHATIDSFESVSPSLSVEDYGFTGERVHAFVLANKPHFIFTDTDSEAISFSDPEDYILENKYDYLRSIAPVDLGYAKEAFYSLGKRYLYPELTTDQVTRIKNAIEYYKAPYEEELGNLLEINNGSESIIIQSILDNLKGRIVRVLDPNVVLDEI